jgi:hypothetical protein
MGRRPLGGWSSADRRRPKVEEQSSDFEYDEAHDALSGPLGEPPAPHRADRPPTVKPDPGGDYGYDEAHDFGS